MQSALPIFSYTAFSRWPLLHMLRLSGPYICPEDVPLHARWHVLTCVGMERLYGDAPEHCPLCWMNPDSCQTFITSLLPTTGSLLINYAGGSVPR